MKKTMFFSLLLLSYFSLSAQRGIKGIEKRPVIYLFYDDAGNQIMRYYCYNDGYCQKPKPPEGKAEETNEEYVDNSTDDSQQDFVNYFTIYPNPTDGYVSIKWTHEVKNLLQKIEVVGYSTPYYKEIAFNAESLVAYTDISFEKSGIYIVKFHLKDRDFISKQIIKE